MNDLTWEEEPRIRALTKEITDILNGELAQKLKELFEDVYGGMREEEYIEILSELVITEQQRLPVAEMRYKRIGEFES